MEPKSNVDYDEESLCSGAHPEQITLRVISKMLRDNPNSDEPFTFTKKKRKEPENTEKPPRKKKKKTSEKN